MIICVSALVIAGAAVSVASFKERSQTETKETISAIPIEIPQEESIEPVGNVEVQSVTKPTGHNMSYEEQGAMMQERMSRSNEQLQSIETQ